MNRTGNALHWIWPSEISPAVAAWPRHLNPKAPAPQRLMRDALETAAIDGDEVAVAALPWWRVKKMPNAAQVAFALFTNVSKRNHRTPEFQSTVFCRAKGP